MPQMIKNLSAMQETWVQSLHWEDTLEKGKATHSSILAWRIPWRSQTDGHDCDTFTSLIKHNALAEMLKNILIIYPVLS